MSRFKGIARYPHLMRAGAPRGTDNLKFSLHVLFRKSDPQCLQIAAEVGAAKSDGFPSGFPPDGHECWFDMAVSKPDQITLGDYMCLSVSSKADRPRPDFVNSNLEPFLNESADAELVGTIVYVSVGFGTYDKGSQGVCAYLNGTLSTGLPSELKKDDLSAMPTAESMFGDIGITPATAPVQPATPRDFSLRMTPAANGVSRDAYMAAGWTDEQLISGGMMAP